MKQLNANLQSLTDSRKTRIRLEAQALMLFKMLLKLERGRRVQTLAPLRRQHQNALRIKTIESQISKIRRELRKIRSVS